MEAVYCLPSNANQALEFMLSRRSGFIIDFIFSRQSLRGMDGGGQGVTAPYPDTEQLR